MYSFDVKSQQKSAIPVGYCLHVVTVPYMQTTSNSIGRLLAFLAVKVISV
jgi:hypothetical protein